MSLVGSQRSTAGVNNYPLVVLGATLTGVGGVEVRLWEK